jgi:multiple sugar transport system ATP-binding protein
MANVVFEDVNKVYPDGFHAIHDLNLEIEDKEFVILVGPSGCGKSTAMRMVAGLEEITGGKVYIGGQVVNDLSPKERDIAMVFQSYALYPHMTVAENMGFALKLAKVPKDEIDRRVREASEILSLNENLDRKPKNLSGGQRQRVAMGRAIVRSPQAFLMDEPLSNLDAKLRVQMRAEIAALQNRLGVTTIYVTHDQVEAMTMGDRVAVLKAGWLQQVDSPQQLYDRPDNLFVAGFIGSPSMNVAEATLRKAEGRVFVELDKGQVRLEVATEAIDRYPKVAERDGGKIAVGMRPEHFAPPQDVPPDQVWKGRKVRSGRDARCGDARALPHRVPPDHLRGHARSDRRRRGVRGARAAGQVRRAGARRPHRARHAAEDRLPHRRRRPHGEPALLRPRERLGPALSQPPARGVHRRAGRIDSHPAVRDRLGPRDLQAALA